MNGDELPNGWEQTTLAELGTWTSGGTPSRAEPRYYGGSIPWVKTGELRDCVIKKTDETITEAGVASSAAKVFPEGTLLIAMYGATIGQLATLGIPAATNQACAALLPHGGTKNLIPFVYYFLLKSRGELKAIGQGGAQPNISQGILKEFQIPVPPLPEQHRIVAKLDSLLAKSRRAREALDAIPPLLEQLRQSVLASAFRGDLTADWRAKNPNVEPATELLKRIRVERRKKWEEAELAKMKAKGKTPTDDKWKAKYVEPEPVDDSELPELPKGWCWAAAAEAVATDADIVYGIVQPGPVVADGVPYVRGMDIVNGVIQEQQLLRTHPDIAKRYERAALQGGDVLLGIIRATKVAVVPDTLVGANITQGTARFRPEKQLLSTSWFARWLESAWTQDWLHSKYRGIDMPGLNLADVRRLPIPVAPRSEQSALITCVEKHMLGLRRLVNEFVACQNATQNFPSALLAKAFRGDLVPQDPNDEPASVMLERLRAERDSEGNVAKKRGKGAAKEGTGNDQKELPGVEGASVSAKRGRKAKPKS